MFTSSILISAEYYAERMFIPLGDVTLRYTRDACKFPAGSASIHYPRRLSKSKMIHIAELRNTHYARAHTYKCEHTHIHSRQLSLPRDRHREPNPERSLTMHHHSIKSTDSFRGKGEREIDTGTFRAFGEPRTLVVRSKEVERKAERWRYADINRRPYRQMGSCT